MDELGRMGTIGIATSMTVSFTPSAFLLMLWGVLITFLTQGKARVALYLYATAWYVFAVSGPDPPQSLSLSIVAVFMVTTIVIVLRTVSHQMEQLEVQRSQLLGSVSHELRNQLTGVIGMIDLTLDEVAGPSADERRDLIELARREAVDATDIIEDLLTTSRMESNALELAAEPVDVDLEVSKIVDHYPAEGVSIQHTGERSGVMALADPVRLRQVLRSLLSNAVRYGGKTVSISVHPLGSKVQVRVADNGPGVPAVEEETIFLPYRRATNTSRHRSSVGLGLWISRRLARAMGGDLTYRRAEEQTFFELTLPSQKPLLGPEPSSTLIVDVR